MARRKRRTDEEILAELVEVRRGMKELAGLFERQRELYVEGWLQDITMVRLGAAGADEGLSVSDQSVRHIIRRWEEEEPKKAEALAARRAKKRRS